MLGVQVLATVALAGAAVLAPAVAPMLGLTPARVGVYAAVASLAAMLSGLAGGPGIARLGALRLSQWALAACAAGALTAGLATAWLASGAPAAAALLLAAALIGAGYGLTNPAATAVLAHHVPAHARGLLFSIKQTGVPIGVAAAGLLLPLGLVTIGWQASVVAVAAGCLLAALALQTLVRPLEPPAVAAWAPGGEGGAGGPRGEGGAGAALLRRVWRDPPLRRLSLASLAYAVTQQSFVTFVVSLLHLELGWTLAAAAGVLAASQLLSVAARIGFGALADHWTTPARLLAALGAAMALACLALALPGPQTPALLVVAAAMACATFAMGWNGVFFAELALLVPRADMGRIAGATQFFTFAGGMSGPLLFGELVRAGGSYALAYALVALVPAAAALALWRADGPRPPAA